MASSSSWTTGRRGWLAVGVGAVAVLGVGALLYRRRQRRLPFPVSEMGKPLPGMPFRRLMGGLDIDGTGTAHRLTSVGPIILGDDATVPLVGGPEFGPHPHKGVQTMGYLISGSITHSDNFGRTVTYRSGDTMWMRAGKGVVHSEVFNPNPPEHKDLPRRLIQLWYQDTATHLPSTVLHVNGPEDHPEIKWGNVLGTLVAGTYGAARAKGMDTPDPSTYFVLRIQLPAHARHTVNIPGSFESCVYVAFGGATVDGYEIKGAHQTRALEPLKGGREISLTGGEADTDLMVFAGVPLSKPFFKARVAGGGVVGSTDAEARAFREEYVDAAVKGADDIQLFGRK